MLSKIISGGIMTRTFGKQRIYLPGLVVLVSLIALILVKIAINHRNENDINSFRAHPLYKTNLKIKSAAAVSAGLSPNDIKSIYNLPTSNVGGGTIAIIDAYDDPSIEADLAVFNKQFGLPACTTKNGCFTKTAMSSKIKGNTGWGLEESLDVEWAHAIAPNANILLVEATTDSGPNLLSAISYAISQKGVVAVSMSWGGAEFTGEAKNDSYFPASSKLQFFAAAGDDGHGASWPAASTNVIAVGGTTLNLKSSGKLISETAWSGSGGGISKYIDEPTWQQNYGIVSSTNNRAIPDVSYNADPSSGYSVYDSYGYTNANSWLVIGGTSAGAPQWAAIYAISKGISATKIYKDAAGKNADSYFRDITDGTNGSCKKLCVADNGYDFITGLGSPLVYKF
jgi:subtilase family serine protease